MNNDFTVRFVPPGEGIIYSDSISEFHFDVSFVNDTWRLSVDRCWDARSHVSRPLSPIESGKVLPRVKAFLEKPRGSGHLRESSAVEFISGDAYDT